MGLVTKYYYYISTLFLSHKYLLIYLTILILQNYTFLYIYIYLCIYNSTLNYIIYLIYLYLGETSLMLAAWRGNTDVVKLLLEHGADINAKNKYG